MRSSAAPRQNCQREFGAAVNVIDAGFRPQRGQDQPLAPEAKAKQMAASASANSALRLHGGRSGRKSGRLTHRHRVRLCDAVDEAVEHHADHEDD